MMQVIQRLILLVVVTALPISAHAQESLPRVLILGDFVYQQPAADVAKALKDQAEVVYVRMNPGEVRHTSAVLATLDTLLGDKKWDIIHFNCGLGDLVYRAPGMKSFRVFPKRAGGVRTTSPQQYENNLRELVKRLKATEAKLIWASTTPIRHSATKVFEIGSEIEYNAIAARVMSANKVPVNDMYTHVKALIDMDKPAPHGFDPFFFDRKPLHPPIVAAIVAALGLPETR